MGTVRSDAVEAQQRRTAAPLQPRAIAAGGAPGRRWMERSALRADCPVLLNLRAHGKTRYVRFAHCARTLAVSQSTMRAARAALKSALLGAP
jgi:hypothetical protein